MFFNRDEFEADGAWRHRIAAVVLVLGVLLGSGVFVKLYAWDQTTQLTCPVQPGIYADSKPLPIAHHLLLVDTTDKYDASDIRIFEQAVDDEARRTKRCDRFSVFSVESDKPNEPTLRITRDVPVDANATDAWDRRADYYNVIWKSEFGDPVAKETMAQIKREKQQTSPIIESIFAIARQPDFGASVPSRRLIIVSDMLQNSIYDGAVISHYSPAPPDFTSFAQTEFGRDFAPNLKNVTVEIYYLQRPDALRYQSKAHCQFWRDFFTHAQAHVIIHGGAADCDSHLAAR